MKSHPDMIEWREAVRGTVYLPNSTYCMALHREDISNYSYWSCKKLLSKHLQQKKRKVDVSHIMWNVYIQSQKVKLKQQKYINGVYIISTDKNVSKKRRLKKNVQSRNSHKPTTVCVKIRYKHFSFQAFKSMRKNPNYYEATDNEVS